MSRSRKLVHVQVAGVDDEVGVVPQGLQQLPLLADRRRARLRRLDGMPAPASLVAANEHLVRSVEEQDAHAGPGGRAGAESIAAPSSATTFVAAPPGDETEPLVLAPAWLASSAMRPSRAGGRLSMTNQPRSSNVAAAVERPAPDMPTRNRYSAIASYPPIPAAPVLGVSPVAAAPKRSNRAAAAGGWRTRARGRRSPPGRRGAARAPRGG